VNIVHPKAKPRPQGTSEIELALAEPVGVSKKVCLFDVAALSHGVHTVVLGVTHVERTSRVPAFDNLGDDSSPDVHDIPPPKRLEGNMHLRLRRCQVSFCVLDLPCRREP
jgi:hypothetical protein